ncbi:N-formylglutamate amidohydrolase [Lignipirellula cremea]|uniref:N-formylglutamate amidohydrolase n=1 Tax=Lignipirellula cremea TaxID=2528010 RepID=A0A518DS54_9BACT|nr:N-formylglutamate amidohydrolase [Lignipirellula cremea]QDU94664.1 N-formylglutamate amidohydrolase [Lignipirellula cremea]
MTSARKKTSAKTLPARTSSPRTSTAILLTCEHGGNLVPPEYAQLFNGGETALNSHRGYDPGALELARRMAEELPAPLLFATVTRLLVELNRSTHHRRLFSEFSQPLPPDERQALVSKHYTPYRTQVEERLAALIAAQGSVLHLSVHSFTPQLDGVVRTTEIGLLYDPARSGESQFAAAWQTALRTLRPDLRVRKNYPYLGKADGFTTSLRRKFSPETYRGIEIEVNQAFPLGPDQAAWRTLQQDLIASLRSALSVAT